MLWFHSIHVLYHHHVHVLNLLWYCWMYKQTTQSKDLPCPWLDYCRWVLDCLTWFHCLWIWYLSMCCMSINLVIIHVQSVYRDFMYVVLHRCNYHLYYQKTFWSFTVIIATFQFNFVIHINKPSYPLCRIVTGKPGFIAFSELEWLLGGGYYLVCCSFPSSDRWPSCRGGQEVKLTMSLSWIWRVSMVN